jgi:hypothetical protein
MMLLPCHHAQTDVGTKLEPPSPVVSTPLLFERGTQPCIPSSPRMLPVARLLPQLDAAAAATAADDDGDDDSKDEEDSDVCDDALGTVTYDTSSPEHCKTVQDMLKNNPLYELSTAVME